MQLPMPGPLRARVTPDALTGDPFPSGMSSHASAITTTVYSGAAPARFVETTLVFSIRAAKPDEPVHSIEFSSVRGVYLTVLHLAPQVRSAAFACSPSHATTPPRSIDRCPR